MRAAGLLSLRSDECMPDLSYRDLVRMTGLALFGVAFAVSSSLRSGLNLASAGSQKPTEDVSFYHGANTAGRLLGAFLTWRAG